MKKYLLVLVCVLALFASSAFAAMSDSEVKAKFSAKADKLSAAGLPFQLSQEQQVSACGRQLAEMNTRYVANFNACVAARNEAMDNANLNQGKILCQEYGFVTLVSCVAGNPPAFVAQITATCEKVAGKAALDAKAAECKTDTCKPHGTFNAGTNTCSCSSGYISDKTGSKCVDMCAPNGTYNPSAGICDCRDGYIRAPKPMSGCIEKR